jgi:hypothetical protein
MSMVRAFLRASPRLPVSAFAGAPAGGLVYIGAAGQAAVNAHATLTPAGALGLVYDPVTSLTVAIESTGKVSYTAAGLAGEHHFNNVLTLIEGSSISTPVTIPQLRWLVTSAAADEKLFDLSADPTGLHGRLLKDDESASTTWLTVLRNAFAIRAVCFGSGGNTLDLVENTLNAQRAVNDLAALYLNYSGYLGGATQFRDLYVYDGKGAQIAKFDGTTKAITFTGLGGGGGLLSVDAPDTAGAGFRGVRVPN